MVSKIFRWTFRGFTAVVIFAVVLVGGFLGLGWTYSHWPFDWPSDAQAIWLFRAHKQQLEQIVSMTAIDSTMLTITPTFTRTSGHSDQSNHWHADPEISEQRRNEYLAILQNCGLKHGVLINPRALQFGMSVIGLLSIGPCSYKGLLFQRNSAPLERFYQVLPSLADEALPHKNGAIEPGYYLTPIEKNWYIYRIETD